AATCLSEQRQCVNGVLGGSYPFTSCMKLPATKSCSFQGMPLGIGQSVEAFQAPSATATMICKSEKRVCQSNGLLTGSYPYKSCTPYQAPTAPYCTPGEITMAQRSYVQLLQTTPLEVAQACVDGAIPTVEGSYPTSEMLFLRFVNTCGNRLCLEKGFPSGRIVEMNSSGIQLECRTNQIPASVSGTCYTRLSQLPKHIENIEIKDSTMAQLCGLASPPTSEGQELINWVYTCGNRACRSKGFSAGRAVEYFDGTTTLECTREEIINQLDAGTLVNFISTNVETVSKACVDGINPAVSDSYPSNGAGQAVRFFNTCGRRYCTSLGYSSGRVTELTGLSVQAVCVK
ncbi:MAG: hypothetical protein ACXWC9_02290, partial [Pseudobdellovibrionaceae bacterium]